ncbi:helicase-associated domain-containing protein [Cellulomonas sp. DKR-3]|uniref:Helicase-associated domain-containing protein n=1 Tax=Cellulomonas fulva TaxID=2835530 RepID=A0ABS5TVD0_9CELL|nr:helicase-associated domain-containing protein [Cellulomonas fulva]MBT0993108.1 helicase-associated domain-containing protein [Cellulomonas fulva]
MSSFTGFLRSSSDERLAALLARRPDLASPSPGNLTSLAVRATGRASLERALAGVDAVVLQVLEAVVVLGGATSEDVQRAIADGPDDEVRRAIEDALTLALLHTDDETGDSTGGIARDSNSDSTHDSVRDIAAADGSRRPGVLHAAPGLAELLGPHPAGLAVEVEALVDPVGGATADSVDGPARAVLDALLWGPPVGLAPAPGTPAGDAVAGLVARGLLVRGQGRHVLLPAAVALDLRGGRTHRGVAAAPDLADVPRRPAATTAAESASAGERFARLVGRLLRLWEQTAPGVLRAGGLAVRDLRRTAAALEVTEDEAALVVELAYAAGLVARDDEEPAAFAPTPDADAWTAQDLPDRWVELASAWLTTTRTPWLVGSRDERGSLIAALNPELTRPWAPRLRRAVLGVLARAEGVAPSVDQVVDALGWATPRAVPPRASVEAVLTEAARVGLLGAGALSEAGRALLVAGRDSGVDGVAAAFASGLAPEVEDLLVQGDLTGIVPGRPSAALEALIERTAVVESRGGALTVRFTPESVRGALDDGLTADEVLERLAGHARGGLPQPLEYLVRDAARRHGRLRAGAASSYLRADDPTLLAGLADDPRLAGLGLLQLAPTVLAAQAPTREVVEALREHGLAPVAETPDGQVLHLERTVRRARRRGSRRAHAPVTTRTTDTLALARRLRSSDDRPSPVTTEAPVPPPVRGTAEPADALALLREAAADRTAVWVELVGAAGQPERRLLRPLRVEGGRLRAADPVREAELTVVVHRIVSVSRAEDPTTEDL